MEWGVYPRRAVGASVTGRRRRGSAGKQKGGREMARRPPCRSLLALGEPGHDVRAGALVLLQLDDVLALGVFQELREGAVAVVALVEGGLLALHRLLDHRAPEDVLVLAGE